MDNGSISLIDIPDGKPLRAFLPIKNSQDRFRLACTFTFQEGKKFFLNFNLGMLTEDDIEVNGIAVISIDIGGISTSIEAVVLEAYSSQRLLLEMKSTITHSQLRDFFRVDAVTRVIGESFHTLAVNEKEWQIEGTTIDISGNGILATFSENLPKSETIRLQITLPSVPPEIIFVIATKIRTQKIDNTHWEVAFSFNEISPEDRDKIIRCCLTIQRQLLRLKVEISS